MHKYHNLVSVAYEATDGEVTFMRRWTRSSRFLLSLYCALYIRMQMTFRCSTDVLKYSSIHLALSSGIREPDWLHHTQLSSDLRLLTSFTLKDPSTDLQVLRGSSKRQTLLLTKSYAPFSRFQPHLTQPPFHNGSRHHGRETAELSPQVSISKQVI